MKNGKIALGFVAGLVFSFSSVDAQNMSILSRASGLAYNSAKAIAYTPAYVGSAACNVAYQSTKAVVLSPYYLAKSAATSVFSAGARHGKLLISNYVLYLQPELVPFVTSCYTLAEQMIYSRQDFDAETIAISVLEAACTAGAMSFLTPVAVTMIKPILKPALVSMVQQMRAVTFGTTGALAQKQRQQSLMQAVRESLFKAVTQALVSITMNITGILALKNAADSLHAVGDAQATYYNTASKIVNTLSVKGLLFKGVCHDAQLHGALERLTAAYSADAQVKGLLGSYADYLGESVQAYHQTVGHIQDQMSSLSLDWLSMTNSYTIAAKVALNWTGILALKGSTDTLYSAGDQNAGYFGSALNVLSTVGTKLFVPSAYDSQFHGALDRISSAQHFAAEMNNMRKTVSTYAPAVVSQGFQSAVNSAQYLHTVSASLHDGQGVIGAFGSLASTNAYNTARIIGSSVQAGWGWFSGR